MKSFTFWHGYKRSSRRSCHWAFMATAESCKLYKVWRQRKCWFLFLKDKSGSKFDFLNCFPVSTNWCEFFFILLSTFLEFNIFLPVCVGCWNTPHCCLWHYQTLLICHQARSNILWWSLPLTQLALLDGVWLWKALSSSLCLQLAVWPDQSCSVLFSKAYLILLANSKYQSKTKPTT